jgi:hypothetical protein
VTLNRPLLMQAGGGDPTFDYSALLTRSLLRAIWRDEGVVRRGVTGVSSLKVAQRAAGANFSVDVQPGFAVIEGDDVTDQGFYLVESSAVENLVVPSPPGSGSRTHRVVAQVRDKLHNGAYTTYDWLLQVLEDTGSGTPATPASAISLATVSVAAAQASVQTANITDTRGFGLPVFGRFPTIGTTADRTAAPRTAEGSWRTDIGAFDVYDGSGWAQIVASTGGPAWPTYIPVLTASSSNPTLGTGAIVNGSWTRSGRKITVNGNFVLGTGATAGSGTYRISLPVTAKTLSGGYHVGSAFGNDTSAVNGVDGISRIGAGGGWDKAELMLDNVLVTASNPIAWAATDIISFTITYEAAT